MTTVISEAAYVAASAAAQGLMSVTNTSLKVDGKWGSFTQSAYLGQSMERRRQIDALVASLTSGGTVVDLAAHRAAEKMRGQSQLVTSRNLSDDSSSIRELVKALALEEGVPVETAMKIAHLESRFRPTAVSPTGATGVFQMTGVAILDVNRSFKENYTKADMMDPVKGVRAGLQYIKIVARYMGIPMTDAVKVYMGFNIGVGSAKKVLAGNYNAAAKEIKLQAYGPPALYAANLALAVKAAPVA